MIMARRASIPDALFSPNLNEDQRLKMVQVTRNESKALISAPSISQIDLSS